MTSDIYINKQKLFDRWAPHYDCLLTTVFYQAVHKRLVEYVELDQQSKVLDLGCGTGRLLHRLAIKFPTLEGTGLDLSTEMISQAQQTNQHADSINYRHGNAEALPFGDEQFDAVFNTISFLHYPNPQKVLSEISRVLRPNGCFYLADYTVPEAINTGYFPFFAGGLTFYSPKQREQLGMAADLEYLSHYYLLCPVMLTVFTKLVV